jgi:hypothetical protein
VSGDGITLSARSATLGRRTLWFTGTVSPGAAGRTLIIQVRRTQLGAKWITAGTAVTISGGSFAVLWRVSLVGGLAARAVLEGTTAISPSLGLTAYRPSVATLYGPGFYGHKTACGTVLRRHTIGVANRTLPCGTPISIYYQGRIVVVPVIDRGPYTRKAKWDLTMATGSELGMQGTETIGALSSAAPAGLSAFGT